MSNQETVTLRALVSALTGEIAWMRIYLGSWRGKQIDCMSLDAIQDAVRAWGDCPVRTIYPGYGFVIVVLS